MKKIFLLSLILLTYTLSFSQVNEELELIKEIFKVEKRAIVESHMQLTGDLAELFWFIYEDYEHENAAIARRRVKMLRKYADQHEKLTNQQAKLLARDYFSIQKSSYQLRKKYYKQLSKTLGDRVALKFIQLEVYVENIIRSDVLEAIPFIGEKD